MIKVGVIGTPNRDKLILPNGATVSSWGGIVYNLLTLNHYLARQGKVRPICPVGADSWESFSELLNNLSSIELDGLHQASQQQNRIVLKCVSHEEKEETANLSLPPLPFNHIQKFLHDLDFLLVNFTSGHDIEKTTFNQIRKAFQGPIMVDVHSLTLSDPDAKGKRRRRSLHDWQEWLGGMEYVQLSWREASSVTGETTTSVAGLVKMADWLLEHGAKAVIVTRGAEGALYFHMDDQGILKEEIPPFQLQTIVDTTGCGDVFSAAFISSLLMGRDELSAVKFAVKASALKATFSGLTPWLKR